MIGPHEPRCPLGWVQRRRIDVEAEKRTGWHEHGILVVAADDHRLNWPERKLVKQLGMRLYGRPDGGGDD